MTESRTIVVTGATRGLGRALVEGFITGGHRVIGCGRSESAIRDLTERYPAPHDFQVVDVRSDGQVAAWARRLLESDGAPDLVINNAALINEPAPLWKISAEEFEALTAVNLNGVANVIRHFVPAMVKRGQGTIANLSSGWGRSTAAGVAPYCTTKWGIEGLSSALADDLPAGLCSVAVNPGMIDTDMLRTSFGAAAASCESPAHWATRAVPFFLGLGPKDSGRPATV